MGHFRITPAWLGATIAAMGTIARAHAGGLSAADAAAAQSMVAQTCSACHGADGNSTHPDVPSLAGQIEPYLEKQLAAFKAQRRIGVMSAIAIGLDEDDIAEVSKYFARQFPRWYAHATAQVAGSTSTAGKAIYRDGIEHDNVPACASCHALDGKGLAPEFPRLAGQHAAYIASQLRAFRSDDRLSNPNAMMRELSAHLSDADIDAVALYIAGMR